jgi:hypothetical protein
MGIELHQDCPRNKGVETIVTDRGFDGKPKIPLMRFPFRRLE